MSHVNYKSWANYIDVVCCDLMNEKCKILEVAAGTGKFGAHLSKKYPNYILSDLSLEMLQVGKSKYELKSVASDMMNLSFKDSSFDTVICLYDSINYILKNKDLSQTFSEISRVLIEDGLFVFDCCLMKGSLEHAEQEYREEFFRNGKIKQRSFIIDSKKIHVNSFEISKNDVIIATETHRQKIYSLETFEKLLLVNSFEMIYCLEDFSFEDATENSLRAHIIARKK